MTCDDGVRYVQAALANPSERLARWLEMNQQVTAALTHAAALLAERPEIVQAWPDIADLTDPAKVSSTQPSLTALSAAAEVQCTAAA